MQSKAIDVNTVTSIRIVLQYISNANSTRSRQTSSQLVLKYRASTRHQVQQRFMSLEPYRIGTDFIRHRPSILCRVELYVS
jgi:hypothetical protein